MLLTISCSESAYPNTPVEPLKAILYDYLVISVYFVYFISYKQKKKRVDVPSLMVSGGLLRPDNRVPTSVRSSSTLMWMSQPGRYIRTGSGYNLANKSNLPICFSTNSNANYEWILLQLPDFLFNIHRFSWNKSYFKYWSLHWSLLKQILFYIYTYRILSKLID